MAISERELESVVELTPEKRYSYFVKRVCDYEYVWVMCSEDGGYAMNVDKNDKEFLYLFPFEEFVDFFQSEDDEFEEYFPKKIKLSKFIKKMIPILKEQKVSSAYVFPVPDGYGLSVDFDKLIRDIELELEELFGEHEYVEKEKIKKLKD